MLLLLRIYNLESILAKELYKKRVQNIMRWYVRLGFEERYNGVKL